MLPYLLMAPAVIAVFFVTAALVQAAMDIDWWAAVVLNALAVLVVVSFMYGLFMLAQGGL